MKAKISKSLLEEEFLMICIREDEHEEEPLFGISYDSILRRESWFWLYDVKQKWMLFHDSESCKIEKLK
jgi:hypothetical protein